MNSKISFIKISVGILNQDEFGKIISQDFWPKLPNGQNGSMLIYEKDIPPEVNEFINAAMNLPMKHNKAEKKIKRSDSEVTKKT